MAARVAASVVWLTGVVLVRASALSWALSALAGMLGLVAALISGFLVGTGAFDVTTTKIKVCCRPFGPTTPGRLASGLALPHSHTFTSRHHLQTCRPVQFWFSDKPCGSQKLVSKTQYLSFDYSTQAVVFQSMAGAIPGAYFPPLQALAGGAVGFVFEGQLVLDGGDFAIPDAHLI